MSFNILDAAKSYLTPGLIANSSSFLGENDSAIRKALSAIIPIVLSGFVTKANSGPAEANDILNIVKNIYDEDVTGGIETLISQRVRLHNKGLRLVQFLFDDILGKLNNSITSFASVKDSSATSLFGLSGLLIGSLLGKFVTDLNMSSPGLSSFLHGQKVNIMSMLPAELSGITNLLGLSEISDAFTAEVKQVNGYASETSNEPENGAKRFLLLLAILIAALALWFFAIGKEHKKERANNYFKKNN
jgi:hypothetical protein